MLNDIYNQDNQIINKKDFCKLIEKHQVSMYRLAKSILLNEHDAEDAVCSAICKAYVSRNTIKNIDSFKSWILKIVSNESYSIFRKNKKIILVDQIEKSEIHTEEPEIKYDLFDAVKKLDEKYRAVVILFYYEDFSIKCISEILNLSQNTIKSRLFRARQKLKADLIKQGGLVNEQ